jgi:hypothetical protein
VKRRASLCRTLLRRRRAARLAPATRIAQAHVFVRALLKRQHAITARLLAAERHTSTHFAFYTYVRACRHEHALARCTRFTLSPRQNAARTRPRTLLLQAARSGCLLLGKQTHETPLCHTREAPSSGRLQQTHRLVACTRLVISLAGWGGNTIPIYHLLLSSRDCRALQRLSSRSSRVVMRAGLC